MYPYNNQMYQQELQNMRDRIDRQLQQVQQNPNTGLPTPITQNFQLAPSQSNTNIKYVNSIDEVKRELVFSDTIFLNKEYNTMWIKNTKGDIRTFNIMEMIQKDEKDIEIENLQAQILELKGMINNAEHANANVDEPTASKKSTNVSNDRTSKK